MRGAGRRLAAGRLARSGRFSYRRRLESSQPVDWRWQARLAGLDLQRQDAREESHQPKIAVVEPKTRLLRRLPYVPGLSRPWPMVAAQAGADAADGPEFLDDLARKDRRSLSQPSISRGIDDEVDRQFRPVAQNHAPFANGVDRDAASHGDVAIDDEFRGAQVDVEARGVLHSPREEAAAILPKVVQEAGLMQSLVEGRILSLDGGDEGSLELRHEAIGNGDREKVGKFGRRLWRRSVGVINLDSRQQRVDARHDRRAALDHRDLGARLPELCGDVVRRCSGPDHDASQPIALVEVTRLRNMELSAREAIAARDIGNGRHVPEAGREHELGWPQLDRPSAADDR